MTKPKGRKIVAQAAEREERAPTEAEAGAVAEATERWHSRPVRARISAKQGSAADALEIGPAHNDHKGWSAQFTDTFGTRSHAFADQAFVRLVGVLQAQPAAPPSETVLNAALALMGAIAPQDELEAALGEQIVGAHHLSMSLMHKAQITDTIPKLEAYINMATKLSRTTAALVDALGKHRSGGKQTHEVRYVYVNGPAVIGDHAQAVFGAMEGGGHATKSGQSHGPAAITGPEAPCGLSMRSEDQTRDALPITGRERASPMQDARRDEPRSADREGERPLHLRTVDEGNAGGAKPRARRAAGLKP